MKDMLLLILRGVSNAYNIPPQDSTLNRHGDQPNMEDVIRSAGGATNFKAIIIYPINQIVGRLEGLYDTIMIDEIQDLAGPDLDFFF